MESLVTDLLSKCYYGRVLSARKAVLQTPVEPITPAQPATPEIAPMA
jgi:hypothetical protein